MEFADRWPLLLTVLALPLAFLLLRGRHGQAHVVPSALAVATLRPTLRVRAARALPALRLAAFLLLVVAVAGPRVGHANAVVPAQGIDIALSLDLSSSMDTSFMSPGKSRLEVTKEVVRDFIKGRTNDRIGLVVFQVDALALSPPTLDYAALDRVVSDAKSGILPDGTGIGVGLAAALNMLRDSTAATRVVVLLTDGEHNADSIRPEDAAEIAAALHIRVYTIGVVDGKATRSQGIDEPLLRSIATNTGGRYFVAASAQELADVYEEINQLETSGVGRSHFERFTEYAPWFLGVAVVLLLAELLLRGTWLRVTPA